MEDTILRLKSDRILAEIKRRKESQPLDTTEEAKTRLVIFTLGKDFFAFFDTNVKEILPYQKITSVPGCPDTFLGIINVRGDIESVINIHRLMQIEENPTDRQTRIIIAESGNIRSGILVNSVNDVIDIPQKTLKPVLSTIPSPIKEFAIAGEILYNSNYVIIMDVEKIFSRLQADVNVLK